MGLIDTHTHLDAFSRRGELPAVVQRARAAGLEAMVAIGTDGGDWSLYRELAGASENYIHYTAGLHPCSVDGSWAAQLAQLEEFWWPTAEKSDRPDASANANPPRIVPVAVGEIGLDRFHLPKDDPGAAERIFEWQREAFAQGLALAKKLGRPVVVHSRGAFRECVDEIDASGLDWTRVIFHCFAEGPAEMAELSRRGAFGSFTGIITYKTADPLRAAALAQGLDRLMLETDAPYLTPMPHRGKPNEPAYLRHTAEYCAQLFGVSYERLVETTTTNARRFFGI